MTLASDWQAHVMPMHKQSTQKNHRHILDKHLLPRFGDLAIAEVTRQEIQGYTAHLHQAGYAPKTIDHIHDVLSSAAAHGCEVGPCSGESGAPASICRRAGSFGPSGR